MIRSSLMRVAFEELAEDLSGATPAPEAGAEEAPQPTIVMKGPLAEVYTEALNVAYAKTDNDIAPALESQAIDAMVAQKIAEAIEKGQQPESAAPCMTVYGVSQSEITENEIVEVTQELSNQADSDRLVLIIDATQPGPNSEVSSVPQERIEYLSTALESIGRAFGATIYRSLKEFAAAR